jgi:drug/metabolite transporter (DMT)-like permease
MSLMSLSGAPLGATRGASSGALLALLAAVSWGGGDFSGGMGVKAAGGSTRGALRVVITAHTLSLLVMAAVLAVQGWSWSLKPGLWGLGCGVVAGLSLSAFYVALARGTMGASAAVSGLLAAAIPAAVGMVLEGRPSVVRLLGFGLAAAAIWLVAAPSEHVEEAPEVRWLAIAGGVGFGLYFAGLKFANPLGVFEPMALARIGSLLTCLLLLAFVRGGPRSAGAGWLTRSGWLWAVGVAVLDTGGNLLYIAATRAGRLDVAAVLAALYPASTILLAALLLKERPGRRQLVGMAVAVAAVVMVTV